MEFDILVNDRSNISNERKMCNNMGKRAISLSIMNTTDIRSGNSNSIHDKSSDPLYNINAIVQKKTRGVDEDNDDIEDYPDLLTTKRPDINEPVTLLPIKVGVMLPFLGDYPFSLEKVYGITLLALRKINDAIFRDVINLREDVKPRNNGSRKIKAVLHLTYADTGSDGMGKNIYHECSEEFATFHATNLYYETGVVAYLGPLCYLTFISVAYLTTRWNIPLITSLGPDVANSIAWPTAVRTGFKTTDIQNAILALLSVYGWNDYFFLYLELPRSLGLFTLDYSMHIIQNSIPPPVGTYKLNSSSLRTDANMLYPLFFGSVFARIFVVEASVSVTKQVILEAYDMGLLSEGDYVFIATELWDCPCFGGTFFNFSGDSRVEDLKIAYESLLIITLKQEVDKNIHNYKNVVKKFSKQLNAFNYDYKHEELSLIVTGLYEGLLLYANALKDHLEEGGSIDEGKEITAKMRNNRFYSEMGETKIDQGGDKILDYIIWDFDRTTDKWIPALLFSSEQNVLLPYDDNDIKWPMKDDAPTNEPRCGFRGDNAICIPPEPISLLGVFTIILSFLVIVGAILAIYLYRKIKLEAELADRWWEVRLADIKLSQGKSATSLSDRISQMTVGDNVNKTTSEETPIDTRTSKYSLTSRSFVTGEYKGVALNIKGIDLQPEFGVNRQILIEFKYLREAQHTNLCRFIAVAFDLPKLYVLMEHCNKGTLQAIIKNESFQMDMEMKTAFIRDIAAGMLYLHLTPISFHGNLRSGECFLDSRFSVKLSGFGLNRIRELEVNDDSELEYQLRKIWRAPEIIRSDYHIVGTREGDVYSFGVIMQEILMRCAPYQTPNDADKFNITEPLVIIAKVKGFHDPPFRPMIGSSDQLEIPNAWINLAKSCWEENPDFRPTFQQINANIKKMNKGNDDNVVDSLLKRMELYASNLELLVEERTSAYVEQKKKADNLLYRIMPESVAEKLKSGLTVEPITYEGVTIYFSDIVGFTSMSSESTPFEVVTFLNDLYTCFDSIISYYDVYKVETIGDAYMVVSGAPIPNGDNHAKEISRMSLALLHAIKVFKIRHKPKTQLKLRIGLHSGPVAAGVVGLKMPRYCLFGYTVNTASCMESGGEALKIHVSPTTQSILQKDGNFVLEPRGPIELKDKRVMSTFWLIGEKDEAGKFITFDMKTVRTLHAAPARISAMPSGRWSGRVGGQSHVRFPPTDSPVSMGHNKRFLRNTEKGEGEERKALWSSHSATDANFNATPAGHPNFKSRLTTSLARIHDELVAKSTDFILHAFGARAEKHQSTSYEALPLKSFNKKA